jgi:MFS transporter, OFA family, oxalate/formate antiporter
MEEELDQKKQNQNLLILKSRWIYVILGVIIMMCLGTVYSYSIFRSPVEAAYNVGFTKSGMPYMASLTFYAIFMLITGRYLDKYNPRTVIIIGGILVALGWILSGFTTNIYILTITYGVIIGSGVGIVYGSPMAVVAKWFPEKKGALVGIVLLGFGLSPFITAPFARYLITIYGLHHTFWILGVIFGIVILLLSYPFRYPTEIEHKCLEKPNQIINNIHELETKEMLLTSNFKSLFLCFTIGTMIGLTLVGLTSNIGTNLIGLSSKKVAFLISFFAVFNGLGRPIFGWLTDKFNHKKVMSLSYSLIIIASVFMLMAGPDTVIIFMISFSLFWFNLGGWLAIAPTITVALFGEQHYSQNYGVVFLAYGIGAITGVTVSGILMDLLMNYDFIFYFVIILCVLGLIQSRKMK